MLGNANLSVDSDWYLNEYPHVAALGMSAQEHYTRFGIRLGCLPRAPSQMPVEISPPVIEQAQPQAPETPDAGSKSARTLAKHTSLDWQDPSFRGEETIPHSFDRQSVRAIAFYLPQFHPIAENDAWWGRGFTEWTNVSKAMPQYEGQYQPHLPAELGFYDLRVPQIQERQAQLAKLYGLSGFCFYFYWFGGKRLLEQPILQWYDNKNIDLPFCLCWANENWSRRWDGLDSEVLIAQQHSPEDDIAFISYISKYLLDPRYIKIDGKPMLLVYRPSLLPDVKATTQRWRTWCRQNGIGEIHLTLTQSFDMLDPAEYGFDSATEFPPNNMGPPNITDTIDLINPEFSGTVYDYDFYVQRTENYVRQPYTLFRSAFPSWDNEARRTGGGTSFAGAAPHKFRQMVRNAADEALKAKSEDEQIIFINAWNEWAEGAHLEPDRRYGYAWLEALKFGLYDASRLLSGPRLVLVVHDAYPHGAQYLSLNLARVFSRDFGYSVDIVLLGDGPLKAEFAAYGVVHDLSGVDQQGPGAQALAQTLFAKGARRAICNTTVTGTFLKILAQAGIESVALIHELPGVIEQYNLHDQLNSIWEHATTTVYSSTFVRDKLSPPQGKPSEILVQGLYKRNEACTQAERQAARVRLRKTLSLPPDAQIVLSVAFGDHRKGIDLWAELGKRVMQEAPNAYFVWVGSIEITQIDAVMADVERTGLSNRFVFPGFQSQTSDYYAGADVYALTSREDPFPTVILEALEVGVPVIAFEGAGGFSDLLRTGVGALAPMENLEAFAARVLVYLKDPVLRTETGQLASQTVRTQFSFRHYCFELARLLQLDLKRVSVVVPNYNYAHHLVERIRSILHQGYPIFELIILDDKSSDNSVAMLEDLLVRLDVDWSLQVNETNSGSACRQWLKGAKLVQGDFVWIAEADDHTLLGFLDKTLQPMSDPDVVMSYCQSQQMAGNGTILCPDYLDYVADIDPKKWHRDFVFDGSHEIKTALAVKNTIPNVSGCVFRTQALVKALRDNIEEIAQYRVAGDWATYVHVLEQGKLAYNAQSLNLHRRHEGSITLSSFNEKLLGEILSMQHVIRQRHNVGPDVYRRVVSYAQELYAQFGLVSDQYPDVQQNPSFQRYFEAEHIS